MGPGRRPQSGTDGGRRPRGPDLAVAAGAYGRDANGTDRVGLARQLQAVARAVDAEATARSDGRGEESRLVTEASDATDVGAETVSTLAREAFAANGIEEGRELAAVVEDTPEEISEDRAPDFLAATGDGATDSQIEMKMAEREIDRPDDWQTAERRQSERGVVR